MIGIHPIHRRLAELTNKASRIGGYDKLTLAEKHDLEHCLKVNYDLVYKLDALKAIAFVAYDCGDLIWQQSVCAQIDELEARLI